MNTASDYVTNVLSPMCLRVKCPSEEDAYAHLQKHMPGTYKCAPTHGNVLVVHCMEKSKFVNKRLLTAAFSSYESLTLDVKGGTLRHVKIVSFVCSPTTTSDSPPNTSRRVSRQLGNLTRHCDTAHWRKVQKMQSM